MPTVCRFQRISVRARVTSLLIAASLLSPIIGPVAADGDDAGNLAVDGASATDAHGWDVSPPVHGRVKRSDEVAFRGTHSLKCEIEHGNSVICIIPAAGTPNAVPDEDN